jgi:hypothetical protein
MPFLYQLLIAKLSANNEPSKTKPSNNNSTAPDDEVIDPTNNLGNFEGSFIKPSQDPLIKRKNKIEIVNLLQNDCFPLSCYDNLIPLGLPISRYPEPCLQWLHFHVTIDTTDFN